MVTAVFSQASDIVKHPIRQLVGFLLGLFSVYLGICLWTYHPTDPSLNRATVDIAQNAGGYLGALLADISLQTIGLAASCFVIVPFCWGVKMMLGQPIDFMWLRVTMLLLATVMIATLLNEVEPMIGWSVETGLGGAIGLLITQWVPFLYEHVLFIAALTLTSLFVLGLSFGMHLGEWIGIGAVIAAITRACYYTIRAPYDWWQERNLERDEDEDEREPWYRHLGYILADKLLFWRTRFDDWDEEDEEEEEAAPTKRKARVSRTKTTAVKAPKIEKPKAQSSLELPKGDFVLPPMNLLAKTPRAKRKSASENSLLQNAKLLEQTLQEFGVQGDIIEVRPGPVVTLYELEPAPGTKSARVIGLADDIARSMSAVSARIAVIPGRNALGIELPNATRETVYFRQMLESDNYEDAQSKLPLALGKDIGGEPIIVDLAKMPHLLVAGTTGSGKSVAINTMIMSLLYKMTPDEVKFIMVDPKMLELSVYDGIPHLLTPVVTEPGKAVVALKWTVKEMENRYRLMSNLGVRNMEGYNKKIREARAKGKELTREVQTGFDVETGKPIMETVPLDMEELPFIVLIVDEMADLMLVAGKDIESSIQRLAQMARAAGIHLIMATQRPSVDVITGVIKANFPTRISFQVTSRIDSRTILGEQGAEQLLGMGDMLYMAGGGKVTRIHGPFASDKEVELVVAHLKTQGEPVYVDDVTKDEEDEFDPENSERDELYMKARTIVIREQKASTSYLQRALKIGYNRAATIMDELETDHVVSPASATGKREVLMD